MNDPYVVLGVSPQASDDEVKKAYRELARKYHPDNYHDNPLADLASEKMKEINEAYDTITKAREGGASGGSYGGSSGYGAYQSQSQSYQQNYSYGAGANTATYNRIRMLINANNLDQAESMLSAITTHDAQWHYLMGSVYWRRGWMDEAARYFRTASTMEPGNIEYRNAVQYMNRGGQAYRPAGSRSMNESDCGGDTDICKICQTLYCADCCCEMMGSDLIRCC